MMTDIFLNILTDSISVSLITIVLIALTPFFDKRYAAKWKYWIWLFLAVRLLLPINGAEIRTMPQTPSQVRQNAAQALPQTPQGAIMQTPRAIVKIPRQMTTPITVRSKGAAIETTLLSAAAMLWAAGTLCFLGFHLFSYIRYKRHLIRTGTVIDDSRFVHQLQELKGELSIKRSILPIASADAASPMVLGFFHAVVVLPSAEYSAEELYFILKHEFIHLKRGDVYLKLLLVTANAVHWFNPFIWLMQKEAVVDMELSCDERVTQGADYAKRKAYTETLLSTLHKQCAKRTALSTQFYGGKRIMKKRFRNILRKTKTKNGAWVLLIVITLTICMGAFIGCTATDEAADTPIETPLLEPTNNMAENNVSMEKDIPDIVQEEAQAWTVEQYEYRKRVSPGDHYTDWRIEALEHCYTYEDFEGMVLQVYRMNIEFLSAMPESVFLVGGMTMTEDGWVVPDYANSRYLVFRQDGETLTLLALMCENDCEAGDEIFTKDLEHQLALAQQPQETPTLTFSQEGELCTLPATWIEGNGYTFCQPDKEWYPCDFENWDDFEEEWKPYIYDAWTAWNNEDVRFCIVRFEGSTLDEAQKELQDKGYVKIDDRMLRQDRDTIYSIEFKPAGTDTWAVCSRYPVDAQEGYGVQIQAIAETFTVEEAVTP